MVAWPKVSRPARDVVINHRQDATIYGSLTPHSLAPSVGLDFADDNGGIRGGGHGRHDQRQGGRSVLSAEMLHDTEP